MTARLIKRGTVRVTVTTPPKRKLTERELREQWLAEKRQRELAQREADRRRVYGR